MTKITITSTDGTITHLTPELVEVASVAIRHYANATEDGACVYARAGDAQLHDLLFKRSCHAREIEDLLQ